MKEMIIHIGTPRTGTTVLQKSLFPKAKSHHVFQKRPYSTTGDLINAEKGLIGGPLNKCILQLRSLATPIKAEQTTEFLNKILFTPLIPSSDPTKKISQRTFKPRSTNSEYSKTCTNFRTTF